MKGKLATDMKNRLASDPFDYGQSTLDDGVHKGNVEMFYERVSGDYYSGEVALFDGVEGK